jgi:hypothetical protein
VLQQACYPRVGMWPWGNRSCVLLTPSRWRDNETSFHTASWYEKFITSVLYTTYGCLEVLCLFTSAILHSVENSIYLEKSKLQNIENKLNSESSWYHSFTGYLFHLALLKFWMRKLNRTVIIPSVSWSWYLSFTEREEWRRRLFQNGRENMSTREKINYSEIQKMI